MMGTMFPLQVTFLILMAATLPSGLLSSDECSSSDENVLQPGRQYTYKFRSEGYGEAVGTTNDRGRMIIECTMNVAHSHECYFQLKLQDCSLNADGGPPGSESAWIENKRLEELSKYPLMFSLSNGEINNIFKHDDDPLYSVNIKRGALSAFVFKLSAVSNEIKEMHTDIHGMCPYHSLPVEDVEGGVKASKDMLYCAYPSRKDWQFSPWSIFWNMSFIQYQINSTVQCEYKVNSKEKRIEKMYCKERHAIGLESTHRTTTAVQTNIYYHVIHVKSEKLSSPVKQDLPSSRSSIQFEYDYTPDPTASSQPANFMEVAIDKISELVEISQEEIRLFTIPKFTDFVAWLRTSYDLSPFVEKVKSCSFTKGKFECTDLIKELSMSYLSDGLIQCNTAPCLKAFSELVINDDLSSFYWNFALYSWTNMHFTKPKIVEYIKDICMSKQTGSCWIMLGTIVKNYHKTTYPVYREKSKEVDEVIDYMYRNVGMFCGGPTIDMGTFPEEAVDRQLSFLKAIGNTGDAYLTYAPGGLRQIMKCITKEETPKTLKKAAFETLHMIDACRNESFCEIMYKKLQPMFSNPLVDIDLRLRCYDLLIKTPEVYSFEEQLTALLLEEKNSQILSYISSDLMRLMNDNEYSKSHSGFIQKLNERLQTANFVLENFATLGGGKSYSTSYGHFVKFPFLPKELQGFGAKFDLSVIYPIYNMIPESLRTNITIQLFNKVINLLEFGISSEGLQSIGVMLKKIIGQMKSAPISHDKISNILRDIVLVLNQPDSGAASQENSFFDENIINSIRKIVEQYEQYKIDPAAFFSYYLNMRGRTLKLRTSNDLKHVMSLMELAQDFVGDLHEGIVLNNTKVIRVIEAYHQVPTMMGLPLNWTTDATLGFSSRSYVKIILEQGYQGLSRYNGDGFFEPSVALTFLNRMVLDFPTYTQIGVQANSSAYTSVQHSSHLDYSDKDDTWRFSIDVPQKKQKILELFRTNQMIKHTSYEDIPDWDIERTSSAWCLNDEMSSMLGMQLCREKSYPNVTHLMKPWALMAGWCKWRLELLPYDRNMRAYNLHVAHKTDVDVETKNHLKIHFEGPGASRKREIDFDVVYDTSSGEADINLAVPNIPQFGFVGKRKKIEENGVVYGLSSLYSLAITKDLKYQLTFMKEDKKEKIKEDGTNKNKSQKSKDALMLIQDRLLKLETPFNEYKWTRKMHIQGGSMKADVHLSFKNRIRDLNWLARILPKVFWEDRSKAWVRFQMNGKVASQKAKETVTSILTASLSTPHSSVDALYNLLKMPGRSQVNLNLTRIEKPSGKLSTFANFTHDLWISDTDKSNEKRIRSITFTIPRKSWNLLSKRMLEGENVNYDITLTRAVMVPKDPNDQAAKYYVGWWSSDVEPQFDLQKHDVKLKADITRKFPSSVELMDEVNNINAEEIDGLGHRFTKAKIGLYYPVMSTEQVVEFDGLFIVSGSPSVLRFQKDFMMSSSYNNLKLTSHSVYRSEGQRIRQLTHNSFFTHTTTDTKAFYNMEYKRSVNENKCLEFTFNHTITSHVFNMKSDVDHRCSANDANQHVTHLNFDSESKYWNMLNMQIRQIIKDIDENNGIENMNFVHPLLYINTTADWNAQEFKKTALLIKRPENAPMATIAVRAERPMKNEIEFQIHGDSTKKLIYQRSFTDSEFKEVNARMFYPDQDHEILGVFIKIINPHHRRWIIKFVPQNLRGISDYLMAATKHSIRGFYIMALDPNHPVNQMLKPALKSSLAEYMSSVKDSMLYSFGMSRLAVRESILSLSPFLQTDIEIVTNIVKVLSRLQPLHGVQQKSITLWAINYFELPALFRKGLNNIPEGLNMLKEILLDSYERETGSIPSARRITLDLGRLLTWRSFNELPFLDVDRIRNNIYSQLASTSIKPHHKKSFRSKIGMIFGPRHVYTFDGLVYEFPKYPSNSHAYLLAHDVHKSLFSVFTTADRIHILFPEMAVSIGPNNDVYINGSKEEQASLPIQSKNEKVAVKREGNIVSVWSPVLTVVCEGLNQICTIELNAWSAGGTLGLLGNADGEIHNEFMLPDGKLAPSVVEFAHKYELNGSPQNLQLPEERAYTDEQKKRCEKILDEVPCSISRYVRDGFLKSCLSQLHSTGKDCFTISALSALCYHNEKKVMASQCHVTRQESEKIRHKLEVVFLVNEKRSMMPTKRSKILKGLESMVKAIDQQFESNGYGSITYTLVGFGGNGIHYSPTIHTVENNVWVPMRQVTNQLLKGLEFRGMATFCPVEAIKYAAEVVGHNTFDSKVFIIVTDNDPQEADSDMIQTAQRYLETNHITLYAIGDYSSIEKGKKVFGVRADGMLFPAGKDGESFLPYPRGNVAKLVSGTRGSLFLRKFVDSNGPATFFTEFATEIWAKVRREVELCRNCQTVVSGWWYYFNQCRVSDCRS